MSIAGPSRVPYPGPGPERRPTWTRESVESTYEDDLLGLLDQLSLEEMDEMQTFFVRRTSAGEPLSDHDLAMSDFLQQARGLALLNEDRALAQRIAASEDVHVGGDHIPTRVPGVFFQPNGDRVTTQRNDNQPRPTPATIRDNTPSSNTWGGWFFSAVHWMFGPSGSASVAPAPALGSVSAAPKPAVSNRPTGHDCVICQDAIRGAEIRAPCGHYYDIDCITDLCQSATKDETLFPPRCCRQNIPIERVRPHLSQTLLLTLQEKQAEFGTLKRVYCSAPMCSRFLGPLIEGIFASKVYTCSAPGCTRRTCGRCRGEYNDRTHICRPDADVADVLEVSRAAGWARCPGCAQMIELHVGCFHMTCRCRTQFCYLCRARWKTCTCPQWDERRLMVVAEERVDAQLGHGARHAAGQARPAGRLPIPAPRRFNAVAVAPQAATAPVPARRPSEDLFADYPQRPIPTARLAVGAQPVVVPAQRQRSAVPAALPTPARPTLARAPPPPPPVRPTAITTAQLTRQRPQPISTQTPTATSTSTSVTMTGSKAKVWPPTSNPVARASSSTASTSASASRPVSTLSPPVSTLKRVSTATATPTLSSGSTSARVLTLSSDADVDSDSDINTMRQRMVREMMDKLRVDHECNHARWRYRSGGGVCQSCGHHLPLYLFRCHKCEMLACNRCRRNRL